MSNLVYLICGVSGSGKTWVCKQLTDKFEYIAHDDHYANHAFIVAEVSKKGTKPIITECPFGERPFRDQLVGYGLEVKPYFVVESPDVIARQYLLREGKPISKSAYSRAGSIMNRVHEWMAPFGNSAEVLELLRAI